MSIIDTLTWACAGVALVAAAIAGWYARQATRSNQRAREAQQRADNTTRQTNQTLQETNEILRSNHATLAAMCHTPEQHAANDRILVRIDRIQAHIDSVAQKLAA